MTTAVPPDLRAAMGRFLGRESVGTVEEFLVGMRTELPGVSLEISDLCHADGPTGHAGITDDETYHFQCFYDAVVLAQLSEQPVDIRTEAPGGTVIRARASGSGDVTTAPESAVMSFGLRRDVAPPESGSPDIEAAYGAICPFVKAFPDRTVYEEWAETVPAATVGLSLADATGIATLLGTE